RPNQIRTGKTHGREMLEHTLLIGIGDSRAGNADDASIAPKLFGGFALVEEFLDAADDVVPGDMHPRKIPIFENGRRLLDLLDDRVVRRKLGDVLWRRGGA